MAAREIYVQGRRIFHRKRGISQTINVCTEENREGYYEQVYRLDARIPITAGQITANRSLDQLNAWLVSLDARQEGPRPPADSASLENKAASNLTSTSADRFLQGGGDIFAPQIQQDGAPNRKTIFLVHGHDGSAKHEVARFLERITASIPVILDEQASRGRTLIEKFEEHAATAAYAVVLATPDDRGRVSGTESISDKPRARQNVVFEMGYFFGKLGRGRVAVLNSGIEKPSDVDGLVYISYPEGNWQIELAKELSASGIPVDKSRIF